MSQSGTQAAAFFRDVRATEKVWFVRNGDGCPAPLGANGRRSLPFWSSAARAARAAAVWGSGLWVESMPLDVWRDVELPAAGRDGLLVGINWSGPRLVGWSFTLVEVLNRLAEAD
ncbi:DUF2750 domain-containing protein [Streptomyces sp. NBC_00879]|uniref:DUF2750 domain-containing protein n=1 Tax=Streptomyces sp. NBC_00879 TaxID=2975855 RepID=UPI0038662376|nr:DUF2750 domain-containing protein [Streptomyces sp. NBC_00879]